jgi:deazaflavin-dependent oxidoreductase (nitroreductase family)
MPLEGEYEISPTAWVRDQTEKIFETGTTESVAIRGRAVVLLTTRGARSGKLRKVPLMRVEHEGNYAIVASLGGAPKNPVWYYNVKAEPHVELQDGTVTRDFEAREVTGEEKAVWWERAVAAYPPYADYQEKTTRQIPVFVLEPLVPCPGHGTPRVPVFVEVRPRTGIRCPAGSLPVATAGGPLVTDSRRLHELPGAGSSGWRRPGRWWCSRQCCCSRTAEQPRCRAARLPAPGRARSSPTSCGGRLPWRSPHWPRPS